MKKGITITPKNINNIFSSLKKKLDKVRPSPQGVLLPKYIRTDEIDRRKYKGRGRPRYNDYIFIDTLKFLKDKSPTF